MDPQFAVPLVAQTAATVTVEVVIGVVGLVFLAAFVRWFCIPAFEGNRRLDAVIDSLRARENDGSELDPSQPVHPDEIKALFEADDLLKHPWYEFRHTLYPVDESAREGGPESETAPDDDELMDAADGATTSRQFRQTVPAREHFTYGSLVESPLRTEFFKHLPGILTGLGIIGTFSGVIIGLSGFDPSQSTPDVDPLLAAISGAFWMSALAIIAAIIVTAVEKILITERLRKVAKLCDIIDSLFPARTGDYYLRRIARDVGSQGSQLKQLKALTASLDAINVSIKEGTNTTERWLDQELAETMRDVMKRFVDEISEGLSAQVNELRAATTNLTAATQELNSMATSAHAAGTALSENLSRTTVATTGIRDAAEVSQRAIDGAATAAQRIEEASDSLLASLDTASQALAGVRGEVEGSREIAAGMTSAAAQLDRFTGDLANNLVAAQEAFANATAVALQTQSEQFDAELRLAVTTMAAAVREIGPQFEEIGRIVAELQRQIREIAERQEGETPEPGEDGP